METELHKDILVLLRLVVPDCMAVDVVASLDVLVSMREGLLVYRTGRGGSLRQGVHWFQCHLLLV